MARSKLAAGVASATAVVLLATACAPAAQNQPAAQGQTAAPAANASKTQVQIMVGGLDKIIYLPAMLTQQLGYFDEEGLDVKLVDTPAGVQAEEALVSGQVQAVVGFYDHTVDLQGKNKKIEAIVTLDGVTGEVELVDAKKADQVKSPADFTGKSLGITSAGSSTDFLTRALAAKNGVAQDQIKTINAGAGDTFIAAITQGRIDAGMTTEPTVSRMLKTGQAKVLVDMRTVDGTRQALGGTYPGASVYVQNDWLAKNKETGQKLANAFVKTLRWVHSHQPAEIADKMPADYYAGDRDLYVTALGTSLDMFTTDGKMPQDAPDTVLNVLQQFDENIQGKQIDLAQTYTNDYVSAVKG